MFDVNYEIRKMFYVNYEMRLSAKTVRLNPFFLSQFNFKSLFLRFPLTISEIHTDASKQTLKNCW